MNEECYYCDVFVFLTVYFFLKILTPRTFNYNPYNLNVPKFLKLNLTEPFPNPLPPPPHSTSLPSPLTSPPLASSPSPHFYPPPLPSLFVSPEILRHIPRARFPVCVQVIYRPGLCVPLLRPLAHGLLLRWRRLSRWRRKRRRTYVVVI